MMKRRSAVSDTRRHLQKKLTFNGSTAGSSLIWVMVVVLVLVIVLGMGLTAVSGRFNLSAVRHEEHQAYYTALSSTETVATWIAENDGKKDGSGANTSAATAVAALLAMIPTTEGGGETSPLK
jgi:type II secretory pathway pseudopilin PulG